MGSLYYTDAADLLRDAGLTVVECDGWKTRARSSGGFSSAPLGIQWHHTASQTSPENDTGWQTEGSDDAPIGNATIMRDGSVWMVAAGASNTAGKGGPLSLSRGTVPLDSGNSTTWAWEVANNGVGEPWPQVQIDAYFTASIVMNKRFGNKPEDIFTHSDAGGGWTDRKIDPAKASAVQGPWKPRGIGSSDTWDQQDCRDEIKRRAGSGGGTPPPPKYAQGIDVSKWQGDIDWNAVKAAGYTWAATRTWDRQAKPPAIDVTFAQNRDGMAFAKWRFLYYWLEPNRVQEGVDELFKSIGTLRKGEGIMLDAEEEGITEAMCVEWLEAVEAKTGVPCAVYTGGYTAGGTIWRSTKIFNGKRARVFAAYTDEAEAREHADGIAWDGWQYSATGKVPGVDADCDLDRIDKPDAFTRCLFGAPEPEPEPEPDEWVARVIGSMPTLKKGASGTPVKRLQHFLALSGQMSPTNMANFDGVFGSGTESSLNKFKATKGANQDGICDRNCWDWFMEAGNGIPTIKKGSNGMDVKRMQRLLSANGFMDPANQSNFDGVWGNGTDGAKAKFDNAHGLTPSPPTDCGAKSWESLLTGKKW